MKSLYNVCPYSHSSIKTIQLHSVSCLCLTDNTRENILRTTASMTGVIRQVRAKMASSLNA